MEIITNYFKTKKVLGLKFKGINFESYDLKMPILTICGFSKHDNIVIVGSNEKIDGGFHNIIYEDDKIYRQYKNYLYMPYSCIYVILLSKEKHDKNN